VLCVFCCVCHCRLLLTLLAARGARQETKMIRCSAVRCRAIVEIDVIIDIIVDVDIFTFLFLNLSLHLLIYLFLL
jgi:hypothetical protein